MNGTPPASRTHRPCGRRVPQPRGLIAIPPPLCAAKQTAARGAERARLLEALHAELLACRRCVCAGYLAAADPVAGVRGHIGTRVMVIGQAPGQLSVARGQPFMGPGGRLLDEWLQRAGFAPGALHREVYIASLTRCFPGKNSRGNGDRKPSPPELALCQPFLRRELELVRPRAVLLVGGMAIAAFMGSVRLEAVVGTATNHNGTWLLPLPHPSGVSRWLNVPAHAALVARALDHLATWRRSWEREGTHRDAVS